MREQEETLKCILFELHVMNHIGAKSEALNECTLPLLNVLKPSVLRTGNPLHI